MISTREWEELSTAADDNVPSKNFHYLRQRYGVIERIFRQVKRVKIIIIIYNVL